MKLKFDKKYAEWGMTAFIVIISSILFFLMLSHFDMILSALGFLCNILMPFIIGLVIAYLLLPIADFFEKKCFAPIFQKKKRKKPTKAPRVLAITITILLTLVVVNGLIVMVLPQLLDSIRRLVESLPSLFTNAEHWIIMKLSPHKEAENAVMQQFTNLNVSITDWSKNVILPKAGDILASVTSGIKGFLIGFLNTFIGLVVAIYVMYSHERFVSQTKKLVYSLFSVPRANRMMRITRRADLIFGRFIKGKLIDALIVGILCFIGMTIFQMPYALLVSALVGVSNIIPFFGPFIGAIPSALLILMIDPLKCLYFIIFITILQQVDGNVICPRILGDKTGLSSFWVIFSIILFGGLFGFVGMIIGVPIFALIYSFIADSVDDRLKKQNLPQKTEDYQQLDRIDPNENQPVPFETPPSKEKKAT